MRAFNEDIVEERHVTLVDIHPFCHLVPYNHSIVLCNFTDSSHEPTVPFRFVRLEQPKSIIPAMIRGFEF